MNTESKHEDRFGGAYARRMAAVRAEGNLRTIPEGMACGDAGQIVDLVSNDYLGLGTMTANGHFDKEKHEIAVNGSMTSSASRLLSRQQGAHTRLEKELGRLYGRPALTLNSGYHANVGLAGALNASGTLFLVDRLAHASIYDGLFTGRCEFERFRHNDMEHLEKLLKKHSATHERVVVVTESIFSMDGDLAPLSDLVALRTLHPEMLLYVDEAHGVGVRGKQGLGLSEETDTIDGIDILVGTFGKALASAGSFVVASPAFHEYFVNTCRSFIFSTALPPLVVAWSEFMLRQSRSMDAERRHLAELSQWFEGEVSAITGHPTGSGSQIVPLVTGSAGKALELAAKIRRAGFDALPIRRPTVPPGGERIRFSLSASHDRETLGPLVDLLADLIRN